MTYEDLLVQLLMLETSQLKKSVTLGLDNYRLVAIEETIDRLLEKNEKLEKRCKRLNKKLSKLTTKNTVHSNQR